MKKYHLKQKMAAAMCAAMLLTQAAPAALAEAVLIRPGEDALSQALAEQYQASQANAPAAQSEQQNNPAPASLEPQQDKSGETQQDGQTEDAKKHQKAEKLEKKELKKEQKQEEKENKKQEESGSADSQQQGGNNTADSQQQGGSTTQETPIVEQVQKPQQVVIENVQQAVPLTLQIQQLEQQIQVVPEAVQKPVVETATKSPNAQAQQIQSPMLFAAVPAAQTTTETVSEENTKIVSTTPASTSDKQDGKIDGTVTFTSSRDVVVKLHKESGDFVSQIVIEHNSGNEKTSSFAFENLASGKYVVTVWFAGDGNNGLSAKKTINAEVGVTPAAPEEDIYDATVGTKNSQRTDTADGEIYGSVTFSGKKPVVILVYNHAGQEAGRCFVDPQADASRVTKNYSITSIPSGTYTVKYFIQGDLTGGTHPNGRITKTALVQPTQPDQIIMTARVESGKIIASITDAMDKEIDVWVCEVSGNNETRLFGAKVIGKDTINLGEFKNGTYKVYADYVSAWSDGQGQSSKVGSGLLVIENSSSNENSGPAKPQITTVTGSVTKTDTSITVSVTADTNFERMIVVTGPGNYNQTATLTAGASAYAFTNLAPGTYEVCAYYKTPFDGITPFIQTVSVGMPATQIAAKADGGNNRVDVTITAGDNEAIVVKLQGGSINTSKTISAGARTASFENIPAGTYSVTIDYETKKQGSNAVTIDNIPVKDARVGISITSVTEGEKTLTIKGTAQAGSQILVQAEPAGAQAEVLVVGADGKFETNLSANPAVYTKVSVFYVTDVNSIVNVIGSWTVTAPTAAPTIAVDPIDNHSTTVVVKTGANMGVILTTPDSTLTAQSDASGLARFSLTHKYLKGEEFIITVVYGPSSGQSVSLKVTVSGVVDYNDLEYGDYGEAVLRLTTRLNQLGYPIAPTKDYNSAVREAVRLFQIANGQEADGEAGDRMQSALYSVSAIRYGSGRYPTLVRGDSGLALIKTLQQRLKDLGYYTIKVDGIFGSGTQRAVRLFQQINGLPDTGIADNATQVLLYSSAAKPLGYVPSGGYSTLQRSSKYKSAVVPLQRRLKELGYYSGSIDGYFGSKTYRAVRNFQSRNGLSVTGVADAYTQQLLYSAAAKKYNGSTAGSSSSTSTGYRLLYWGCRGAEVTRLQNALINAGYKKYVRTADGIYGQWTYDAVCAYQRDHGLTVDGIAGKKTQNKLYGTNY